VEPVADRTWANVRGALRYLQLPEAPEEIEPSAREDLVAQLQRVGWPRGEARRAVGFKPNETLSETSFGRSFKPMQAAWWTSFARPIESVLLVVVMLGFVAISVGILVNAMVELTSHQTFAVKITQLLEDGLLMFIVLEIVETVRQQVTARERLYPNLVRNFLVIGIVSGVRHLLAVGANITLSFSNPTLDNLAARRSLMLELAVSSGLVILLVIGWKLAGGYEYDDPLERFRKK
jgi:hypothetical protein